VAGGQAFYSFRESFLVSSIDKIVSTKEVAKMLKDRLPANPGHIAESVGLDAIESDIVFP